MSSWGLHDLQCLLAPIFLFVGLGFACPVSLFLFASLLSLFLTCCQPSLFALVLVNTELSSFNRLGGITLSRPRAGLLLMVLELLWGGSGKGIGCVCLDINVKEMRWGWQTSTDAGPSRKSGAFSMSMCFKRSAMVFSFCWWATSLVGFGLASSTEILLSVGCRQIKMKWKKNLFEIFLKMLMLSYFLTLYLRPSCQRTEFL